MTADQKSRVKLKLGTTSSRSGVSAGNKRAASAMVATDLSAMPQAAMSNDESCKKSGSGAWDVTLTERNGLAITRQQLLKFLKSHRVLVRRRAEYLSGRMQVELEAMPVGTIVIFELVSGEHVSAGSRHPAIDCFEKRFGVNQTLGWLHEVGGGVLLGGGFGKG